MSGNAPEPHQKFVSWDLQPAVRDSRGARSWAAPLRIRPSILYEPTKARRLRTFLRASQELSHGRCTVGRSTNRALRPHPTETGGRGWADYGFGGREAKVAAIQSQEDFLPVCKELLMSVSIAVEVINLSNVSFLKKITQDAARYLLNKIKTWAEILYWAWLPRSWLGLVRNKKMAAYKADNVIVCCNFISN